MQLSAPIFRLKRKARLKSREAQIPLHQALDQVELSMASPTPNVLDVNTL